MTRLALVTAAALLPLLAAASVADTVLTPTERAGLAVLMTQDDQALVRDRRSATLDKGSQHLVMEGIAAQARDGSLMLSGPGLTVLEQALEPGGLDSERLLAAAIGQEVTLVWRENGAEREQRARVLAPNVFQTDGKVVAGTPLRIFYDQLPPGLRPLPAFRAQISAEAAGKREVELAYLSGGLSWQAEYVAELAPGEDRLALSAWANLGNSSGADFPQAKIQLMAGELNRVADAPPRQRAEKMMMAAAAMPSRQPAGPYHLYTLPHPVDLKNGTAKQVALMAPQSLAAERSLVLEPLPPQAWRGQLAAPAPENPLAVLTLKNSGAQPLPAGTMRVFSRGKDGAILFLGEERLPATPSGAEARIALGRAFDVTARRSQTDFSRVSAEINEAAWEVKLANAADQPAKVVLREAFAGDWLVVEESARHTKENAFTAAWTVTVPAKSEALVKYRVRVKG